VRSVRHLVGGAAPAGAITSFGRAWTWVALAGWAVVFGAMVVWASRPPRA